MGTEQLRAARAEADAAVAEAGRARTEAGAARAELDRLVRARVDVQRELTAVDEALRRWLGPAATGQLATYDPASYRALASTRRTHPRPPVAAGRH
ncbi:MAG: hypothetical protein ACR2O6_06460, partial [Ilumatobacteraceae bacterium]